MKKMIVILQFRKCYCLICFPEIVIYKLTTHIYLVRSSKSKWSYTSTPQYVFMAWCPAKKKKKRRDNCAFTFYLFIAGSQTLSFTVR